MPGKSLEIQVVPTVLKWARETIGKSVEDVAKRFGTTSEAVQRWESGTKKPTLRQLREMAGLYKRPLAAFFLPAPPQEPAMPVDFRTLPKAVKRPFSEKTLLVLRRARRLRRLAGELAPARVIGDEFGKACLPDSPEEWANRTRMRLQVSIEAQFEWKDEMAALVHWRRAVERIGVCVFEMPFPVEEGRAFSLFDPATPAILLNGRDATVARIFSLFHEYGHLLLGEGAICDLSEESKTTERFCNRFAAEFLVCAKSLLGHSLVSGHSASPVWAEEDLRLLAGKFKVSREAVLRRLLALDRTTQDFYRKKKRQWETEPKPKPWGKKIPSRQCVRQNGVPFVSIVLESARSGNITARDASDYLDIPVKHLPDVESVVREESAKYA